jgi:hypothetical protein
MSALLGQPGRKPVQNIDPKGKSPLYEMFNEQLAELLAVLRQAIPENASLKLAADVHSSLRKLMPGEPMRRWLTAIEGYAHLLESRTPENEAKFIAVMPKLEYICELDIVSYWDEFEDDAKDNLWAHLRQLDVLANTVGQFSPDLMAKMESMAEMYANDLDGNLSVGELSATVLDRVINDASILQMIGVDPAVAQSAEVKGMAGQMLSSLGNLNLDSN